MNKPEKLNTTKMKSTIPKITLVSLLVFSFFLHAQENNYWSHQYGAKSTLLAGAAVATYFDNGAIFYNPATLCFKDSGNISLSANLYQAEFQNVTNGLGDGINFGSTNYNFAPQIVSGNKKLGKKLEVEFIVLSKTNLDFAYNVSHYNIYPLTYFNSQAQSQYIGNFSFRNRIIEDWAGLAMSFKLNEKWGLGLTDFFGYRFQKYSSSMNATAISLDTTTAPYIAKSDSTDNYRYDNLNNILKLGIVYNGNKINFGMTVTCPSINIVGQGRLEHYVYFSDPALGSSSDYVSYSKRQRVKTKFRTPLSFSFGLTYKTRRSKIHLTCEYFFGVKPYYLLQKPDDAEFVDGDVAFNSAAAMGVIRQTKDVLNFAVGIERTLKGKTIFLMGINHDANAAPYQNVNIYNNNFSMGNYDLTHGSVGIAFTHNKNNIAVGVTGSWGSVIEGSLANFRDPNDLYRFFGTSIHTNSTHSYRSIALVVGLTY